MRKLIFLLIFAIFFQLTSFASIESVIENSKYSKNFLITVAVKDLKTSKTLYERNKDIRALPASVLKVFTMKAAVDTLGYDYKFKTSLYKDKHQNLYLKLSGDPKLMASDVLTMLSKLQNCEYNTIYIDDTALDDDTWGAGWSWDNNAEEGIQKFGAYNINDNSMLVSVTKNEVKFFYPYEPFDIGYKPSIINKVDFNDLRMYKLAPGQSQPNALTAKWVNGKLYLNGSVHNSALLIVPVNDIQETFWMIFKKLLQKQNIEYNEIAFATVPPKVELIAEVSHDLDTILNETLKESNNFYAETIFKTAGGKYKNSQGTTKAAIEMFADYYDKNGVSTNEISIVDASGVSRKDMLTAKWAVDALSLINKDKNYTKYLPTAGEGTLKTRLSEYKNNLHAKTGSLDGISGIVGYITTKKGTPIAFCIFTQNYKHPARFAKETENAIIKEIYENY